MVLNRAWVSMLVTAAIASGELRAQGGRGRGAVPDSAASDLRRRVQESLVRLRVEVDSLSRRGQNLLLYGFALECGSCDVWRVRWDTVNFRTRADSAAAIWMPLSVYRESPRVAALAPGGAAERAGILVGDSLVAVNGESIITPEGMRQFRTVKSGEGVRLTLRRNGGLVDVTMTMTGGRGRGGRGEGAELSRSGRGSVGRGGGREAMPADAELPLRVAGNVGTTPVEVMSDTPVSVEMEASGDLVIRVAGSTVRVRPTGTGRRGGRGRL